ncbi:MAG: hypothetical protein IT522_02770 [Burkholderiales bacterium]|nr:hypothetical protein [Burkholderiales bacterium]
MQRFLGRMAIVLLAVLLTAGAIEQTYRVYLFGWSAFSPARIDSVHDLWVSGLIGTATAPGIVYELKPHLDAYFKLVPFRTDSRGLRDVERPLAPPAGVTRLAVVGASFSMPAGVAIEDAWHQDLARRLDANVPSRRHEAINFAVGGYSARQLLAVLESKVFAYRPRLVLVEFTTHTPRLVYPESFYTTPYVVEPATHPFWSSFVVERLRARFTQAPPDRRAYTADELASMDAIMQRAAMVTAANGAQLCFVILNMNAADADNARTLAATAARHAPCVVDTTPAFAGMDLRALVILPTDPHPNAAAHAIFAGAIAPVVAPLLAGPPS